MEHDLSLAIAESITLDQTVVVEVLDVDAAISHLTTLESYWDSILVGGTWDVWGDHWRLSLPLLPC